MFGRWGKCMGLHRSPSCVTFAGDYQLATSHGSHVPRSAFYARWSRDVWELDSEPQTLKQGRPRGHTDQRFTYELLRQRVARVTPPLGEKRPENGDAIDHLSHTKMIRCTSHYSSAEMSDLLSESRFVPLMLESGQINPLILGSASIVRCLSLSSSVGYLPGARPVVK